MNKQDAKTIISFCHVLKRDANSGKPTVIEVPGHDGKRYEVILRRKGFRMIVECRQQLSHLGHSDCKGQIKGVCYHSLAAVHLAINEVGATVSWCDSQEDAVRLANFGGQVFEIRNFRNRNTVYGVIKAKETQESTDDSPNTWQGLDTHQDYLDEVQDRQELRYSGAW